MRISLCAFGLHGERRLRWLWGDLRGARRTDASLHAVFPRLLGAAFGEVLAREYGDISYASLHRLTVDTYAVQHPGRPSAQSIQSVALHLMSLCLVLERGVESDRATAFLQAAAKDKERFVWLAPPVSLGSITVRDVHGAESATEHKRIVRAWAESAWSAWSPHHAAIKAWLAA